MLVSHKTVYIIFLYRKFYLYIYRERESHILNKYLKRKYEKLIRTQKINKLMIKEILLDD